jgi:hypothetical protein
VVAPTVSVLGQTKSPYAITYPSQSSVFFAPLGSPNAQWYIFYSDGTNLVYQVSTDGVLGQTWTQSFTVFPDITGYSYAVTVDGSNVYIAFVSTAMSNGFTFKTGIITPGPICAPSGGICWSPNIIENLVVPVGQTKIYASGSPSIVVDDNPSLCFINNCLWITIPALDNNLNWHIQVFRYNAGIEFLPAPYPVDIPLHLPFTSMMVSSTHAQIFVMGNGVAVIGVVSNTPSYPSVTFFSNAAPTTPITYCVGGQVSGFPLKCPAVPASWSSPKVQFFEQQAQGVAVGNTLYFAGLAQVTGMSSYPVEEFSWSSTTGAFSAPSQVSVVSGILSADLVNHSWHVAMTYISATNSLFLTWGSDSVLAFSQSTDFGVTWSTSVSLNGISGVVNGITATSGPAGTNTIGLVWVAATGSSWHIEFAVV